MRSPSWLVVSLAATVFLSVSIPLQAEEPEMTTLRGSATYSKTPPKLQLPAQSGKAYAPSEARVQIGDALVSQYKLGEAYKLYQAELKDNPKSAGALNGMGKVLYSKTASSNQDVRDRRDEYLAQAIQSFLSALRYEPNYIEARVNLGKVYEVLGRLDDAEEEYLRALTLNNHHAEALARMGSVMIARHRSIKALPYLQQALRENGANNTARYALAKAYTELGEYSRAYDLLQNLPNSAHSQYQLGQVFDDQGNGAAAVNSYKKSLSMKPEYQQASLSLADHYAKRGDLVPALETLKNALEADQGNLKIMQQIAELSLQNNQPQVAGEYYQRMLLEDPTNAAARLGLSDSRLAMATTKHQSDRLSEEWAAQKLAGESLNYNSGNLDSHFLNVKLDGLTNPERVNGVNFDRGYYNTVMMKPAVSPQDHLTRGEVLIDRYQFQAAEHAFSAAIQTARSPKDVITMGEVCLNVGMPEQAKQAFQRAIQMGHEPGVLQLGFNKANRALEESMRKTREAAFDNRKNPTQEQKLLEAIKLNQRNADAHFALAHLYEKQKRYDQAADHYYAYLQLRPTAENRDSIAKKIRTLQPRLANYPQQF